MSKAKKTKTKRKRNQVIDPAYLSVDETDLGVQLWLGADPLMLPNGTPLAHPRLALIDHIKEELSGHGTVTIDGSNCIVKPKTISAYWLLCVQREIEGNPDHDFVTKFKIWLLLDPCLSRCAGPEAIDQILRWDPLRRFYIKHKIVPPDFAKVPVDLVESDDVESLLRKRIEPSCNLNSPEAIECIGESMAFAEAVEVVFRRLGPEEWAVMKYLFCCDHGILFPLLLVTNACTIPEYANGLMASQGVLTTAFDDVSQNAHAKQSRILREIAQVALHFLEHARCPWTNEILKGEDEAREFKATLRYDLATTQHNKELEHSVLKNVAAFLNSQGGTLFVGVADSGEILGIEMDGFENNDKWALHLVNRIGQQIGKRFLTLCAIEFDLLHGKAVSRISVKPSAEPAFLNELALKSKGEKAAFFIRGGPSAQKLTVGETDLYLAQRFSHLQDMRTEP